MMNIRRECYLMVDLSRFISNKKILSEVVEIVYNKVYSQILSFQKMVKEVKRVTDKKGEAHLLNF